MDEPSNVTPIRPPKPSKPSRKRLTPKIGLQFREFEGSDGDQPTFFVYEAFAGLQGVCATLNSNIGTGTLDQTTLERLEMAAHVLVSVLAKQEIDT